MGRNNVCENISKIREIIYEACPELVPFAGNVDLARMLGQEDAEAFAKRKWAKQIIDNRKSRPHERGPLAMRKRGIKKSIRELPRNSAMCETVLSEFSTK